MCLFVDSYFCSKMEPPYRTPALLTQRPNGTYFLTWQDPANPLACLQRDTSSAEVEYDFPEFCMTVMACHDKLNLAIPLETFEMCAAYSYTETVMKWKRFQVHTQLARAAGFADRSKLPLVFEDVIKDTWHDDGRVPS
jgi:hypothetical protein